MLKVVVVVGGGGVTIKTKYLRKENTLFKGCRDTLNKWSLRMVDKVAGFYLINNPFVCTTRKLLKTIRALYYKLETARPF